MPGPGFYHHIDLKSGWHHPEVTDVVGGGLVPLSPTREHRGRGTGKGWGTMGKFLPLLTVSFQGSLSA